MRPQPIAQRLGKRRSSLRNSMVLARIAGSWQSGACYVQRAENPRALAFFPPSFPPLSVVLYYHLRSPLLPPSLRLTQPIPFAFFGRSSRKQNEAPPRSRFHTSSLLFPYLFLARKSSRHLHNTLGDALFFNDFRAHRTRRTTSSFSCALSLSLSPLLFVSFFLFFKSVCA